METQTNLMGLSKMSKKKYAVEIINHLNIKLKSIKNHFRVGRRRLDILVKFSKIDSYEDYMRLCSLFKREKVKSHAFIELLYGGVPFRKCTFHAFQYFVMKHLNSKPGKPFYYKKLISDEFEEYHERYIRRGCKYYENKYYKEYLGAMKTSEWPIEPEDVYYKGVNLEYSNYIENFI